MFSTGHIQNAFISIYLFSKMLFQNILFCYIPRQSLYVISHPETSKMVFFPSLFHINCGQCLFFFHHHKHFVRSLLKKALCQKIGG